MDFSEEISERSSDTESEDPLTKVLSDLSGIPPIQLHNSLKLESDVGLDSLGRVELLSAIEEDLEIFIDDGDISPEPTIADLQLLVGTANKTSKQRAPINWGLNLWAKSVRKFIQSIFICYRFNCHYTGLNGFFDIRINASGC